MLNRKKIIAIVAFILIGFAIFTFANPRQDNLEPITEDTTNDVVENPGQPIVPVVNPVNPVVNPVVVDNAPVITVEPELVKVVDGYDYDALEGVTVTDDIDTNLPIQTSITEEEIGYVVTYTVTDRSGNTATGTRTIIVLDPDGDEDEDHYTNEEEIENGTDFDDEEDTPEYDYAPSINVEGLSTTSVVYDAVEALEAVCSDEYYGTRGVTCVTDSSEINNKKVGTYKVYVTATDILGNETTESFDYVVTKRVANVTIDNKESVYGVGLKKLTYTTSDELEAYPIGVVLTKAPGTNVGTYAITGTYTNENYDVTFVDGTYTIKKATLDDETISFAAVNVTYDGKEHKAEVKGLPKNVKVTYVNNKRKAAGTQTATATFTYNDNYEPTTLTTTITIAKRNVEVTIKDKSSIYGEPTKGLEYIITSGRVIRGDKLNIALNKAAGTDAGTYAITGTYNNTNYNVTFVNGTYTITKKEIPTEGIKFDSITVPYDGKDHKAEVKNLDSKLDVTYTNNVRKEAGTQTATATLSVKEAYSKNYEVKNNTKTTTITINKVNATAPQVGRLEANEGTKLSEITLPAGFTLKSNDKVLEYKKPYYENVTLTYCPQDTTNYNCVDVEAKVYVIQQVFTVTFMSEGKVYDTQRVKINGYAKLPSKNPEKKDYTFAGWSVDVTKTPVTADMEVVASFTANLVGLKIYEKPNAHFEFKKDPTYQGDKLIRDLIIVKEVYADGEELDTTSYTTNFDIKTTGNKTLVVNQGNIRSINTIPYKVIENIAFQTKFEVILKEKDTNGKNSYRETKDENCKRNCDTPSATRAVELNATFLEVIEHYDEEIEVEKVDAIYANTTKTLDTSSKDKVRWSRFEGGHDSGWYDPVRLAILSHEGVVGQKDVCSFWIPFYGCTSYHKENIYGTIYDDVMTTENPIKFVDITYTREFSYNNVKKYVIRFAYNPTTKEYKAVSEKEI